MKIGIDARPLCVPMFGIGRYTLCLFEQLLKNTDITWYLYADRPLLYKFENDNVVVREYPSHKRLLSLYRTQIPFAKWAKEDKLDLFWSPRHHLPLWMDDSIKTVLTIHDLVWQKFPETMLPENLFVEKLLMRRSAEKADAVIAVSDSTRSDICLSYPHLENKVKVIHAAINHSDGGEESPCEVPYFLCVGTLEPRKNLVNSIAAFKQYRAAGGNRHLVIIGGLGWKLKDVSEKLSTDDVEDYIHLLGRVDDELLMRYYKFADVFLFPSLYEGFGLPALEAMQFAVPVISSNCSSLPEVVGEGGILIDPLSVDDISEAMIKLTEDEKLREELGQKALIQSKKFSWENAAEQTLATFRACFS